MNMCDNECAFPTLNYSYKIRIALRAYVINIRPDMMRNIYISCEMEFLNE
jgi:hypothetical protein